MKKRPRHISAQVFLKSPSGLSLRRLGEGPLPPDLASHLPPPEKRREVVALLEKLGFRAFADDMGLGVSIDGPESLFHEVFGWKARRGKPLRADETVELPVPKDLASLVEAIVVLPTPEHFG